MTEVFIPYLLTLNKLVCFKAFPETRGTAAHLQLASGLSINRFISLTLFNMQSFIWVWSLTLMCLNNSKSLCALIFLWLICSTHICHNHPFLPFFFTSQEGIFRTLTCPGQAHWGSPSSPGCAGCGLGLGGPSGNPFLVELCWVAGPVCVGTNMWYLMVGCEGL